MRQTSYDGLRVDIAPDRERLTVRAVGEIDLATAPAIEKPLLELLDSGFTQGELSGAIDYLGVS
ncbi:MAG: hypothetical protein ACXVUE_03020 [Solirubrobacteraceae bacterium]